MTLHLEGKLTESVLEPATYSVFCGSAIAVKCCPRSGFPLIVGEYDMCESCRTGLSMWGFVCLAIHLLFTALPV